jgi:hypothetical protein
MKLARVRRDRELRWRVKGLGKRVALGGQEADHFRRTRA